MKEPTDAQVKELWERCGFRYGKFDFVSSLSSELDFIDEGWISPLAGTEPYDSNEFFTGSKDNPLPSVDLNNLFKYAKPAVIKKLGKAVAVWEGILLKWFKEMMLGRDPALALFWAIWAVMHKGEE